MIFKNALHQKQFSENGFCVFDNFLNEQELAQVDALYEKLNLKELHEIYSNIKDRDESVNTEIDATLVSIFKPSLDLYFKDYRTGGGAFLVKGTGESSVSSLHQDWNVVDESKYVSMGVWCPLVDVDEKNGCLQVVKGSNNWFNTLRSINMPSICVDFEKVESKLVSIPAKRGTAVVFAHNVFHGSMPNYTGEIRPAASVSVMNKEAGIIHYYKNNDKINILNAETFFNDTVNLLLKGENPGLKLIGEMDFEDRYNVTHDEFYKIYKRKSGLFAKLFG